MIIYPRGSHCLLPAHRYGAVREGNRMENDLIVDVAWNGVGFAMQLGSGKRPYERSQGHTAFNTGYAVIQRGGGLFEVSYNHVHHGALVSKDCALLFTPETGV